MRPIDADACIDELMERCCKECDKRKGIKNGKRQFIYEIGGAPCRACEVDDIKAELEEAPTIEPIKWNLCKKEMPLCTGTYLVTLKEKYSFEKEWRFHVDVADSFGDEIDNFWDTFNDWKEGQEIHVIAWADLPEPYEPTIESE